MSSPAVPKARRLLASYEPIPESVGAARRALARFAQLHGACEQDVERIKLASSEALSNAVIHAYGGAHGAGLLDLQAACLNGELIILVADQGCGLGGARESEGLGLGLAVMTRLCDSLRVVTTSSGGTRVEMRFRLGPSRAGASASGAGVSTRAVG